MVILRKSVITLVTGCCLFVGTSIYAQSTSSMSLADWYKKRFQNSSDQINEEVLIGRTSIDESVETERTQWLKEIEKKLEAFVLSTSATANSDIENYKNDYLKRIAETKDSLLETELMEIDQEIEKTQKEIESSAFTILTELLSENGFDGTTEK